MGDFEWEDGGTGREPGGDVGDGADVPADPLHGGEPPLDDEDAVGE